jgi:hypothetical protein
MRLLFALLLCCAPLACSRPPANPPKAEPAVRLAAIPDADQSKYEKLKDMKGWQNPYLIVHQNNIGLLDASNNLERILTPEQVLNALADLPASSWPYGRVAAVREPDLSGSEEDKVAARRNRGILAGTLAEAKVQIKWVPAS